MKIIISALLLCTVISNAQWLLQPSGVSTSLNDISMPGISSTDIAWAVGVGGKILKTTNGGINWQLISSPTGNTLTSVHCFNESTVLAVGWNGVVIKTTNSGFDWTSNFVGSFDLESVQFINSTTGFACGETGVVWKTTDAGSSWTGMVVNSLDNRECYFINSTTGYTCGPLINTQTSSVKKTTNSGASWQQPVNIFGSLSSIIFFGDQKGWSCGSLGTVARTTNGGTTWGTYNPLNSAISLFDIYFSKAEELGNGTTGWMAADSGKIFVTTNSGINWVSQGTPVNTPLLAVKVIGNLYGWAVGNNGVILRTTNGGIPIGIINITTEIPASYYLSQNYPNPFNPTTNIEFSIPKNEFVSLKIYDLIGREAAVLYNGNLKAGTYKADFNATGMNSGVYFYKLQTESYTETRKMILVK